MTRGMPTPEQRQRERDEALLRRATLFGENQTVAADKEAARTFSHCAVIIAALLVFWLVVGCAVFLLVVHHVG
jgi:hypothetical protein